MRAYVADFIAHYGGFGRFSLATVAEQRLSARMGAPGQLTVGKIALITKARVSGRPHPGPARDADNS